MYNNQEGAVGILGYIENNCSSLTASLKKIALYIIANPGKVVSHTTADMASELDISEASIVRFCKTLGFKGFADFKIKLARDLGAETSDPAPAGISPEDSPTEVFQKVLRMESDDIRFTLDMLDEDSMHKCLDLISVSNKIAFFGIGSSAIVAESAREHFLHYGRLCFSERDSISQISLANGLKTNDLAFAISASGQSAIPLQAMRIAKANGAHTVCLTQSPGSALADLCDCVIIAYRRSDYVDDLGTVSRTVHDVIIDALAIAYAVRNWNETKENTEINRINYQRNQFEK